jgi:hypothetical protein
VSKKAQRIAAGVVAAVQQHCGVAKSAGTSALLMAVALPMAETIAAQDRHIKRTGKQIRKQTRLLRQIAGPELARPFAPPARGMVPFEPGAWRVGLQPSAQPSRNGFHVADPDGDEDRDGQQHDRRDWS